MDAGIRYAIVAKGLISARMTVGCCEDPSQLSVCQCHAIPLTGLDVPDGVSVTRHTSISKVAECCQRCSRSADHLSSFSRIRSSSSRRQLTDSYGVAALRATMLLRDSTNGRRIF